MSAGLRTFLLAALALIGSSSSGAVILSPEGIGQALIFPYYTVRSVDGNAFNTYISASNVSGTAKSIRVRFREGKNGREVAGFNLYLGVNDGWAGVVVPTASGVRVATTDRTCTGPAFSPPPVAPPAGTPPQLSMDFSALSYSGANTDGLGEGIDRAREGYVEMIEMATLTGDSAAAVNFTGDKSRFPDCAALLANETGLQTAAPTGGLLGSLTLINVADGTNFTVNADALAGLSTLPFHRHASDAYPDFDAVEIDPVGLVLADGSLYRFQAKTALEAVEFALMRSTIENEVILDAATRSNTDWVVTMPTRRFHIAGEQPGFAPFNDTYSNSHLGHDIPISMDFRARSGGGFSFTDAAPATSATQVTAYIPIDATTSVVGFAKDPTLTPATFKRLSGASRVLGSVNGPVIGLGADSGSAALYFRTSGTALPTSITATDGSVSSQQVGVPGLPTLGFMVRTFRNGTLSCGSAICQGNYGAAFPHRSSRTLH